MTMFGLACRCSSFTHNPLEFLLRAAQIYPEKLALVHPDVQFPVYYTYSIWAQRVQNFAYGLLQAGIRPGDRIAVLAPNWVPLAARAIITTINTRLTKNEIDYILAHSVMQRTRVVVCNDTGRAGDPYEDFLTAGRAYSQEKGWPGLEMDYRREYAILSGTTGRTPDLALAISPGTYLAAIANAIETQMNKESTYLWILPMFHAAGWTFPWSLTLTFAKQIIVRTVDYSLIWKHFLHSHVTHYCGAPTVQIGIANHPDAKQLPHPIKAIIAGAAPTAHLLAQLEGRGFQPVHVYGLTETYGPFTRNYSRPSWFALPLSERAKLSARQGHAFATASPARVVYPTKSPGDKLVDVPRDGKTVGEIVTRGNIGGHFHSGDLAVWHPDGSVQIQDRSKDIIISGGENASSLAIEQELAGHPDVLEVSVVAREHPKWGERPMAFVIMHAESAKRWADKHVEFSIELKAYARERLPSFAVPEWVAIVKELPKTSTGKIQKTVLRKRVAKL
ncbi:acetyl-CoA synthetase-like protein [Lactarius sanguifluus]|nr:acetyl-CoA synthetase-like protein [Lactarius sanguifluus]